MAGELERRLGQFEQARSRFLSLTDREEVKTGILRDILDLQLQLIEAKNSRPQRVPQKQDPKK